MKHNHVIRKFPGNGVVSNKLFDWNGGTNNNCMVPQIRIAYNYKVRHWSR